ncbi:hypothetical protein CHH83_02305 [Bacillus sp. 7586-K]|nr:hypothetical protein CHH83_02305 [Bacillus sp. 7586-K]
MENNLLTIIWQDIMNEFDKENLISDFKFVYSKYSEEELKNLIKTILPLELENKPFRTTIGIYSEAHPLLDNQVIVYSSNEINYKDLLVALYTVLFNTNTEIERMEIILKLAQTLQMFDRDVAAQFAEGIAEEVYWSFKHGGKVR